MIVGVPKETYPGENRVAMIPAVIPSLTKGGLHVVVEKGAGSAAGFLDEEYSDKGAKIVTAREELFTSADVLLQVRSCGANPEAGKEDLARYHSGQIIIGFADPLSSADTIQEFSKTGATLFSMEMVPRITRAQSMDALSSMATIAGYKAVLLAANNLPRIFPMLMTAAGTVSPARVFIIGAGVAGLQAIATAKRLGSVVQAYDVRPAVKEQVQSVGAKFIELDLETESAEGKGGYAKAQGEEFYRKQRELMMRIVADSDVVITTAAIPGKKAPILVTADMVKAMRPGSVIVDLAAERGGNCELTKDDEVVVEHGVTIIGTANLPSTIPYHASQMYAKNIATLLLHLIKDGSGDNGQIAINTESDDEIIRESVITRNGEVVNTRIRELLGLETETVLEGGES